MASFYWVTSLTTAAPTAAFDAIELVNATGGLKIWRYHLWQTSDLGDAAEEVLRTEWARGNTTSGSGGQTTAIGPLNSIDGAATFTAEIMNTTQATTTTPVSLDPDGWNIRMPKDMIYAPEHVIWLRGTERCCLRVSAPTDAISCNASCLVEQV